VIPTLKLNSGDRIPVIGLGLWKVSRAETAGLVQSAIHAGYRHLDCACDYGNETEVGHGISAALVASACRRDELWITSKLWNTFHSRAHVRPAVERTLHDLQVDYLDLYLVHFPIAQEYVPFEVRYPPEWLFNPLAPDSRMQFTNVPLSETWMAMESLVTAGLVRNIGVSNYTCALLRDLLSYATIAPAVLQVELHPYLTQERLIRFCHEAGIAVTGFSPLGALSYLSLGMAKPEESVLEQAAVLAAAQRHGKTAAQVVLRWGVQRGTAIVTKTSCPQRLAENLGLFDFELSAVEMAAISAQNCNRRFNDPGAFCEAAFRTFCPIYE
jgi:D-xylose reductase